MLTSYEGNECKVIGVDIHENPLNGNQDSAMMILYSAS
jgi:hypothetical protein